MHLKSNAAAVPAHIGAIAIHAKIVELSKKLIRRNGAELENLQDLLGLSLHNDLGKKLGQRSILRNTMPSFFIRGLFGFGERLQGMLPSALGHLGIRAREIRFRELEVD